jgi:hypothetical protein
MRAIREKQKGSYLVGGEQAGQPEYFPLEVRRGPDGALWSAWEPSWRDWFLMLFGRPVRVGVLANRQPPILVLVNGARQ